MQNTFLAVMIREEIIVIIFASATLKNVTIFC